MARLLVPLAMVVLLVGCVPTEPEFTEEEQMPEEERETAEAREEGEEGEEEAADDEALTFVAIDIDFSEAPETAAAGESPVRLVNEGEATHNVVFEGVQGDEPVAEADGGDTADGTVTLEDGTHTYYCSVPGHREAGMEGQLQVEG